MCIFLDLITRFLTVDGGYPQITKIELFPIHTQVCVASGEGGG